MSESGGVGVVQTDRQPREYNFIRTYAGACVYLSWGGGRPDRVGFIEELILATVGRLIHTTQTGRVWD